MNSVAFVFFSAPHGSSAGREGLDALLSMSVLNDKIGVFFISDGIFQILTEQHPDVILARNYINTFKVISLYGIKNIWICSSSMQERGLSLNTPLMLDAKFLLREELSKRLSCYNIILTF